MKDKLQDELMKFMKVNLGILLFVAIVISMFLFFTLCTCFIDMSFNPIINLDNSIINCDLGKALRLILILYVFGYLYIRTVYSKLKNEHNER